MAAPYATSMNAALQLTAGTWTDITDYLYNRTQPAVTITRGRPDETTTITPSQMTGQLNNRDGRFTSRNPAGPYYPDLTRNTPVRLSVPDSGTYLRLEDDATSGITCPDTSGLQLTAGVTVLADVELSNYMPCLIASKWGGTGTAWAFYLNGDGTLGFAWYDGSTGHFGNSSTQPIPYLGRITLIAEFNASAGTIEFLTATTIGGTPAQLGATLSAGSTTLSAAAGQAVAVGGDDFAVTTGSGSLQGQVFEVTIKNTSGTVLADPQFHAQAAGATSFTDAQSNTWTVNGTCELSNRSYRYHGEMSSLPVAWDPSGRDIWVPFQASGILRRLSQGNAPVLSPIRRAILSLAGVEAYWPCEDGQGATQIASGLAGGLPMYFTSSPGFATDSNFPCSNPLPDAGTSAWNGNISAYTPGASFTFGFLMDLSTEPPNAFVVFLSMDGAGSISEFIVGFATTGPILVWSLEPGGDGPSVTVPLAPVMVLCTATQSGSDVYMGISVIDAANGEIVSDTYTQTSASFGSVTSVQMNPGGSGGISLSGLGHIFIQNGLTTDADMAGPATGYAGETAGNRFARLCTEYNIAPRVYGPPDTTVVMGAQGIDTLGNLLQNCETADNGMLYEPRQSFGIGYRTLASICNQGASTGPGAAATINYAAAQAGDQETSPVSLTSIDDDQYTRNDITVTRTAGTQQGSSYEYALDDGSPMSISAPPAGVGDYANAVSVNVETDTQLPGAAGWLVHVGTVLQERYPTVTVGLHRPEIIAAGIGYTLQDVNIGDYIQVTNPPAWLPPGTISQIVAGVTEQLSSYLYQIAWNSIPEVPYETGLSDDLIYGRADTDGSTLASGVSATATTLSVATTGVSPLSPLWTTSAGDFPFYISIGGEQIEVTNITGSSSPQSFTVTRSVNGVVKSQSSGADVRLFYPPIAALT